MNREPSFLDFLFEKTKGNYIFLFSSFIMILFICSFDPLTTTIFLATPFWFPIAFAYKGMKKMCLISIGYIGFLILYLTIYIKTFYGFYENIFFLTTILLVLLSYLYFMAYGLDKILTITRKNKEV